MVPRVLVGPGQIGTVRPATVTENATPGPCRRTRSGSRSPPARPRRRHGAGSSGSAAGSRTAGPAGSFRRAPDRPAPGAPGVSWAARRCDGTGPGGGRRSLVLFIPGVERSESSTTRPARSGSPGRKPAAGRCSPATSRSTIRPSVVWTAKGMRGWSTGRLARLAEPSASARPGPPRRAPGHRARRSGARRRTAPPSAAPRPARPRWCRPRSGPRAQPGSVRGRLVPQLAEVGGQQPAQLGTHASSSLCWQAPPKTAAMIAGSG